ncbi:MAG: hypothetical protein A2X61_12660 [Ignavibacteria bacterium GWB2_35_12]|nr:MAG: hypothetical protein A2X63_07700 [Ignavibacteria bacterium GWA2_35_8]OGU41633.1 MAG: hypothetical protein A2X61_12660 [Ignavibacteria bacterium GWB2_35_12]OGU91373.1 MAG: hypothetical protein A2220_08475 [Ignavibacteria bacterium RIFOXYA2_FULL_35_10]OGV24967.1 MAG: hypothetical protein A2475_16505 [Ignavibacteria bacterium RIFOXYC2_FULL_35_21]
MLEIKKLNVYDDNHNQIAVQIPVDDYLKLEEIIENYGLAKLMDEVKDDDLLTFTEAETYYQNLKK